MSCQDAEKKLGVVEELQGVPDIGPIVAAHIVHFLNEHHNQTVINKLLKAGIRWPVIKANKDLPLTNKTFVLTGTLANITREAAKERLEKLGAKVSNSVSSKTTYIVVGENPGSKLDKASAFKIKLLDETAFYRLLKDFESD